MRQLQGKKVSNDKIFTSSPFSILRLEIIMIRFFPSIDTISATQFGCKKEQEKHKLNNCNDLYGV